ncbi:MAG: hypothetical protein ACK2UT_05410, partial [Candidatus Promineifilaceae bacterium]
RGACLAHEPPRDYSPVVDEVEVPHREMGANRTFGKIERSADASQGCHTLIQCPFAKLAVKPARVTARQIGPHVAHEPGPAAL